MDLANTNTYCIDKLSLSDQGEVLLIGWAFDKSLSKEINIQLKNEKGEKLSFQRKKIERPDVNHTYGIAENIVSGFELRWKANGGQKFQVFFGDGEEAAVYPLSIRDALFQQREDKRHYVNFSQMMKEKDADLIRDDLQYLFRKGYGELKKLWQKRYEPIDPAYTAYFEAHKASQEELREQREHQPEKGPSFSLLVPAYKTKEKHLRAMIESVIEQSYQNWQLCIADGSEDQGSIGHILEEYHKKDQRVCYKINEKNLGISGNTNEALKLAEGDYIVLLDHDDLLAPDALYELASLILKQEDADVIYTDEDKFSDSVNGRFEPAFKPDFNLDLLRSNNYICHMFAAKREIALEVGGFHSEFDGSQDYDFIFRCCEKARMVYHIPKVLYYWRSHPDSVAENPESKTYAYEAGKKAIEAHLERCGVDAEVIRLPYWGLYRVKYKAEPDISISVIVRKEDAEETAYSKRGRAGLEMIELAERQAGKGLNQRIEEAAKGDYFLFLSPNLQSLPEDSLEELVRQASRQDAGAVGARIYDSENRIAQAGYVFGLQGLAGSVLKGTIRDTIGYCAKAILQQDYSAVSPAAYMISRETFLALGGFDEQLTYPLADLDLQLRLRQKGLLCIYEPEAEFSFKSKEGEEKKSPSAEENYFRKKWEMELSKADPYYNENFSLEEADFSLKRQPLRE